MAGAREDCPEDHHVAVERFIHQIAKSRRADFHGPNFVDDDKPPRLDRLTNRLNANGFERRKIETIFPNALRRCEIDMGQYHIVAVERHDLKPDSRTVFSDLLGIKATGALRQLVQNALDQRCFAGAGPTREENFLGHTKPKWMME